jgi:hypothetical protein
MNIYVDMDQDQGEEICLISSLDINIPIPDSYKGHRFSSIILLLMEKGRERIRE